MRMIILIVICLCMGVMSVQINPNIGTIIKEKGYMNGAVTKLDIIAKMDKIPILPETPYPAPCDYLPLATELFSKKFSIHHYSMTKEYEHMCKGFERIRTVHLKLRKTLMKEEEEILTNLQQLRGGRERRSLGGFLRATLGIAHLKKQKRLQNTINSLSEKYFEHEGNIKGLDFMLKIQDNKISVLNNVTEHYLSLMNNVTGTLARTIHQINDNQVITRHTITWISDALSSGGLYNQIWNMHNNILRNRVKAVGDLAQGRLSTEVIEPRELDTTLTKLQAQLKEKYVGLQITEFNIWDYYTLNNIISYVQNGSIYFSIPVNLQMFDQAYQLYEINTFMVPVESYVPQATIIMDYIDLLAVNEEQNNYFGVTRTFLDEYCNGRTVLRCNYLFTSHDMTNSPSCASVIYQTNWKKYINCVTLDF